MNYFLVLIWFFNFLIIDKSYSSEKSDCHILTEKIGKEFSLPHKLLTSISYVESGITKNNEYVSWPWTLNVEGKSKYFDTKEEAIDFLSKNYSKKKNIDIGCMQISTKFHAKKFENLNQILDPETNVKYAARLLKELYKVHKTWNEAISRYHSSIPKRKKIYLNKVHSFWNKLRQQKVINKKIAKQKDKKRIEHFKKEFEKQILM